MTRLKNISCNICNSRNNIFLFKSKDRLHGLKGEFTYVKCAQCGLVYMNPQIDPDDISTFYPADYAPHRVISKSIKGKKERQISLHRTILEKLDNKSKVLDVGCGSGKFLNDVQKCFGCQVDGLDISENSVNTAKNTYGLKIFHGDILEAPFRKNHFDLITAFSYIEHVHNPNIVIKKISELLKPNGMFLIKTPNIESWAEKLFKSRWYHLDCPRHLYLFSPKTLSVLIKQNGLSIKKILFGKSSKGWTGSLQYCLYDNNYQSKHRNKIKRSKIIRFFASSLARSAYLFNKSDLMTIYGFKKT